MNVQIKLNNCSVQDNIERNHFRLSGSLTHNQCKSNHRQSFFIPVVFHNLFEDGTHFIIFDLSKRLFVIFLTFRQTLNEVLTNV